MMLINLNGYSVKKFKDEQSLFDIYQRYDKEWFTYYDAHHSSVYILDKSTNNYNTYWACRDTD